MSLRKLSSDHTRLERLSRNSTGAKEEFSGPRDDVIDLSAGKSDKSKDQMLMIVFVAMVFVGLGNKIFNKLETIPMHNYPNFLNLLTTAIYVPCTFAYIIPMVRNGTIPREQTELPKMPFAVMGGLDAMAGIMQIFAATYLPGPLVILLSQAAIPVNMTLSRFMLQAKYNNFQYLGAVIVAGGIATVLVPTMTGGGSALWAIVMILSTIPMTLSSVYKEIAMGDTELDPIYLNGWIAVFQLLMSILLCVPASLATDPPVPIPDLPMNLWNGLRCFVGISSITCDGEDDDCTADDCYPQAPMFVSIYLVFNQLYNLLILLLIKYGSSNLLWMAMTLMVPLGNCAFTLPFVPEHSALRSTDIIGLVLICGGLGCYRFAADAYQKYLVSSGLAADSQGSIDDKGVLTRLLSAENDRTSGDDGHSSHSYNRHSHSSSHHLPKVVEQEQDDDADSL